nr:response regulator [Desulfobulbaceae bacterium]
MPTGHERWMRTIIVTLFLVFGILTQLLFNKIQYAKEVIKQTNLELDQIFQTAADGMRVIDLDYNVTRVNRTFLQMTNLVNESAVNRKCHYIFSGEQCFTPECPLNQIVNGKKRVEYETSKKRLNGTELPCIVTATPFFNSNGEIVGIVENFKDISLQKKAEEERKKLESDLLQAHKMEAIGTLAGGISHDFNNILNGILTYTRLLTNDLDPGSKQADYVREITNGGERAAKLVQQIMTFSRVTEHKKSAIHIQTIVKEALNFIKRSIPATIELQQFIEADCAPVKADATQIYQVVINLCTNAYHAMRQKGGVLQVRLEAVEVGEESSCEHELFGKGKYVKLSVSDTGHGMDELTKKRIFDPYFTTKGIGEGTGLGLSRVHGIITSHYGYITVESEIGKGATFAVYLPVLTHEFTTEKSGKSYKASSLPSSSGRILLVDDETYNARSFELILRDVGYDVVVHTSSLMAFEEFSAEPNAFDIVITDLTMPILTGIELSQKMIAIRPDIPVILMTGHYEIMTQQKAKLLGVKEFMQKPIDIEKLVEAIDRSI